MGFYRLISLPHVRLVLNGMKLQVCRPSFFDARDAIIQADQVLTGGENFCELWAGFSARGLGQDAKVINRTPWGGGVRTNVSFLPSFVILGTPFIYHYSCFRDMLCPVHARTTLHPRSNQHWTYITRLRTDGCSLFKRYCLRRKNAPISSSTSTYLYHIHAHHINIYTRSCPRFCLTFHDFSSPRSLSGPVSVLVSYVSRSSLGRCILVYLIFRREIYRFCFQIF